MNASQREYWRRLLSGSPDVPDNGWRKLSIGVNADRVEAPLLIKLSRDRLDVDPRTKRTGLASVDFELGALEILFEEERSTAATAQSSRSA